jgi:hypothetical protein
VNRVQALAALDEAFSDRLKTAFDNFSGHAIFEGEETTQQQFEKAIDIAKDTYARATAVIKSKFPE